MSNPQSTETVHQSGSWPLTVLTVTNYSKTDTLTAVTLTLGSPEIGTNPAIITLGDVLPATTREFDAGFHATMFSCNGHHKA